MRLLPDDEGVDCDDTAALVADEERVELGFRDTAAGHEGQ
jgi:hypothetical protein